MKITPYNYAEISAAAITDPTDENLADLAAWFEEYGEGTGWNGESWDVGDGLRLYPVHMPDEIDEESGEVVQWKVSGYELK